MKPKESRYRMTKGKSPITKSNPDLIDKRSKDKGVSPMRGLKIKVLDYSPAPSRGSGEPNRLIKMQKDVAILKQKEIKISKKLKLTENENAQLIKIKKKTEENIAKQKKLLNSQIDNVIETFVGFIIDKRVYLDLGKDYEIDGKDYKYPPDSPVDRKKGDGNFELPTHLTSSCVILGNEKMSYKNLNKDSSKEIDKQEKQKSNKNPNNKTKSKRDLSARKSIGKRSRSPLNKTSNLKKTLLYNQKFSNKSSRNSRKSLELGFSRKSKSPKNNLKKSISKDIRKSSEISLKKFKQTKNENLTRYIEMNTHLKKLVLKKTVFMPSTLRALARTVEHKY